MRPIFIYLFSGLCLYCSCSNENSYDYARSPRDNARDLNMRGEPLRETDPDYIASLQQDLKALGYDPGPANGTYSPQTRSAVMRFQQAKGIYTDGCLGPITEQSIRKAIKAREELQKNTPARVQSPPASSD